MSEILFILTTLYVAYVVYMVVDEPKAETHTSKPNTIITPSGSVSVAKAALVTPVAESAPVAEAKTEKKVETVNATAVSSNNLRDPETGEVAKVTNNYRGLKRWLKEALVAEGLLEKVYSNSELNDETNAKIKVALETIKTMSKYHA